MAPSRAIVRIVGVCCAALCALTGCSGHDTTSTPPASSTSATSGAPLVDDGGLRADHAPASTPSAARVDAVSAEQTIRRGVAAMFTWYPAEDTSPADAITRAAPYLSAALSRPTGSTRLPAEWAHWKAQRASVIAAVVIQADESGTPDSTQTIRRVVVVRQRVDTGLGAPQAQPDLPAWVTATRGPRGWLVTDIHF